MVTILNAHKTPHSGSWRRTLLAFVALCISRTSRHRAYSTCPESCTGVALMSHRCNDSASHEYERSRLPFLLLTFVSLSPTTDNEREESFYRVKQGARYTVSKASLKHLGHVVCTGCGRAARFLSRPHIFFFCVCSPSYFQRVAQGILLKEEQQCTLARPHCSGHSYARAHNRGLPPAT